MAELVRDGEAGKLIIGPVRVLQPHLVCIRKGPVGTWRLMTYIHEIKTSVNSWRDLRALRRGSSEDGSGTDTEGDDPSR